ncbi:phytanoyl-CoA dioxygenase family protein [Mameliella sediminis]|uniref:phytanoyl-CoA dioxygenase family protein n=1 Tax=Mameliella sediminis TaxID=2836866 RepID=UPI001C4758F3|nr:phytanoyl-CoA dioxygenase family protein [Mameliella sediminis]MBV7396020.1 phytanoyl-CoA dioxygenase family protein [Mameliella sediminis]
MKDTAYFDVTSCDLAEFAQLTGQSLSVSDLRFASAVEKNVPVYDIAALQGVLSDPAQRAELLAEWGFVLGQSAGALALKGAYQDTAPIDRATEVFERIIAREHEAGLGAGDHFAKAGSNARIWNSLQKHCLEDPQAFALYYGNTAIAAVCEAWLGPFYQMTAQVNLVRPGGQAQSAHRDYHLGFQTAEVAARFPAHVHDLSAVMTLQGAVAHCDMPIESGPTKLLPFSQLFRPGYMAYRREDFREYFEENCIQLPLSKGDAVFFNPALFHAAGENRSSDIHRMANLLQVSSAFGRAMETVDRSAMCGVLYPAIQALRASGKLDDETTAAAIGAAAEGYSFPTNLDSDPPLGGLAPETQNALFHRALSDGLSPDAFAKALAQQDARRQP